MGDSEKQGDFDIKGLSLIDVSSEDDCLINSPLCEPINPQSSGKGSGTKSVRFAMDPDSVEISLGSLEENGKLEEPPDSLEQDKTSKNGKYNLRKSLAWDSAFFTSAGVLDPEELSSMIGGNEKGEIHTLPGIREDVNKSCDSLTTLDSETLTLESLEADLFEDIRASIQKSNKASNIANSSGKKESKTADTPTASHSKKMKQKAASKKQNICVKDPGKTMKQVSVRPQISQVKLTYTATFSESYTFVARSGEPTSSLHKPPKALSRVGPLSTTPSKRVSLGSKNVKMEKDAKSVTGRGTTVSKTPALGGLRNIVPRPTLSSKSSSCSPVSIKTELTTSCSSLESCASASSGRITKSSLNSIKQTNDSRIVSPSSSGCNISTPSKIASKGKNQAGSSRLSTFSKSSTKLSSSISPASSISDWSSESSSSTSTVNQRSNFVRPSLGTGSCKRLGTNRDAHQVLDSQDHPTGHCSMGDGAEVTGSLEESVNIVSAGTSGLLHPASMKPSGLRMPSPKLGFFDGVRSSGRTPNGSMLSHPGVPNGLPKIGAKSTSPSGSLNKAKIGKLQPVRTLTAIRSPKVDVKQTSSAVKSRSSLTIQKSPNAAAKVSSAFRNPKSSPGISPKFQNKSSPKTGRESYSKAQGLGGKDGGRIKDTKIVPLDGVPETTDNLSSKYDDQNTIPLKVAAENETYSHLYLKTDTLILYNTKKKEEAHIEDQIAGTAEGYLSSDTQKEPNADSHLAHGDKKVENCLSKSIRTSPSPMTSEITAGSRRPFSVKDSFYNMDAHTPLAVTPGSAVEVDKTATLQFPESISPENS
ncbi:mucin-19-like isoform X2 [Herrania umbratica]|uniref:Mucin-19-like isoform X2 n=1 Tax=Herrania umbratica TaxID=108875 RepID=A0A6J1ASA0_9ROSI|nr:mucin-19-like isoform X2 [Herrania umbratica]